MVHAYSKQEFSDRLQRPLARGGIARHTAARPPAAPRVLDAAVLFVDIRNFTAFSERVSPLVVMELLQAFYSRIEPIVHQHGGTLEKYIGDAVLATFGAGPSGARNAESALLCSYRILEAVKAWNRDRWRVTRQPVGVGLGLHYGPIVSGTIGSSVVSQFVVAGDTVNTASRLQDLTRQMDTDLVVSEALLEMIRPEQSGEIAEIFRSLTDCGELHLCGRRSPVRVHILRGAARRFPVT